MDARHPHTQRLREGSIAEMFGRMLDKFSDNDSPDGTKLDLREAPRAYFPRYSVRAELGSNGSAKSFEHFWAWASAVCCS
jgi:hypothetical protein